MHCVARHNVYFTMILAISTSSSRYLDFYCRFDTFLGLEIWARFIRNSKPFGKSQKLPIHVKIKTSQIF